MARIYFNCPLLKIANSERMMLRWILLVLMLALVLLAVLTLTNVIHISSTKTLDSINELHYGIVIDCGSSGSRIFVYYWPTHSGNPKDLLNVQQLLDSSGNAVVKKISPGLSSYEKTPDAASDHIKELLLYAQNYIPKEKIPQTSLYVMATAGMRMLASSAQQAILQDLREDIGQTFQFIAPENHFEIISGKQEGVYAWIAINYALDRFSHGQREEDQLKALDSMPSSPGDHQLKTTVGIIDMGGASIQIAFEITDQAIVKDIPASLLSEFNLGCQDSDEDHKYNIYVTTFLGYGANAARKTYETMLLQKHSSESSSTKPEPIQDVCLPTGMLYDVQSESGHLHKFLGQGDYEACQSALEPLMNLTAACSQSPCSLNGIYQPKIDLSGEFYGFSEFWYSTEDVFNIGGPYDYQRFHDKAKEFCKTHWITIQDRFKKHFYPKADDARIELQCFKSAWMTQIFHKGFSFPTSYSQFTSAQLVNGKDVGWTLGALIYKTRFLPLRDIERLEENHLNQMTSSWQKVSRAIDASYLLSGCFLIVLAAIFVYMKRLKCCPRTELPRVASMSYFMTEPDQMEQGLTKNHSYSL
ncbi:ectonucleoside triphosphate diphosphohydrolase 7 [Biomphalaria pfeifferi]|uniref:Ectonucleoside triphosphate diphosphohydrolase 7 n=1 Tax=Biomphalaria pfeifferi TaxID=112525 RepID=A0AAD8FN95_BIOPF|nr:ectonucleoside triphosphate diphosphohydrolase 7 [Biomphalaria pfeifferi]